jgi:hypothetical protein
MGEIKRNKEKKAKEGKKSATGDAKNSKERKTKTN